MTDQMPTREQIAEAIYTMRAGSKQNWHKAAFRDDYLKEADAVLALFPQPTPSAEDRNAWDAVVQAKRAEQRAKGYTAEHDREHGVEHLLLWAQDYASRGRHLDAAALVEAAREVLFWQRGIKSDYDVIDEQYRGVVPPAEPVSIADMAPGNPAYVHLNTNAHCACPACERAHGATPPPATPEEGDRG